MIRPGATWIRALAVISATSVLSAGCGDSKSGGGSGGGNTTSTAANTSGPFGGGGAWLKPTNGYEVLNLNTPRQRPISAAGYDNYANLDLTEGDRFLISSYRLVTDASLAVTKDAVTVAGCLIADNAHGSSAAALDCTTEATIEGVFFEVVGPPSAPYTVVLTQAPDSAAGSNEGSSAAPVSLTAGAPRIGQVGGGGTSYYSVTGLYGEVAFNLAGTSNAGADVDLELFSNSGFSTLLACTPASQIGLFGTSPESCILAAAPPSVFIKVSEHNTTSTQFMLIADPVNLDYVYVPANFPAGTAEPIGLNTPIDGTVGLHEFKSYVFNAATNGPHTISLVGISSDGDPDLYTTALNNYGGNCGAGHIELGGSAAEDCVVNTAGYANYAGVYGYKATASYTLFVSQSPTPGAGGTNEGSAAGPIAVQRNVPFSGETGAGNSYYRATGLAGRVTVSLMNFSSQPPGLSTPSNVDLEVFADSSFQQPALKCESGSTFAAIGFPESCVILDAPSTLYVRTKGTNDGSQYVLLVH